MSASAKPTERAFKSLLAVVLAVSLCPLMPAGQAKAQEVGEGSNEMGALSASVDAQSSDADDAVAPQSGESGDPIVDWTTSGTARWMIDASGGLVIAPLEGEESGELENWRLPGRAPWRDNSSLITSAKIEGAIAISTAEYMFYGCSKLSSLDLSGLDTSNVEYMSRMFCGCSSLQSLDLSGLDTSSAEDMADMFYGCSKLSSLDLSAFDTSKVTGMAGMFSGCSSLSSLDLSAFDTSKVTRMAGMFSGCSKLASLDLSGLDTSSATEMTGMFEGCSKLISLDLSAFDTSKVTGMAGMFEGCSSLQSLDLSGLDTSNVKYMAWMFYGCSKLASLDLSGLDASKVADMNSMFRGCSSLSSLDLSSFDTSSATGMPSMFRDCSSLTSLDLSSFDTSSAMGMSSMFSGCSSLSSLDLSSFDTSKVVYMDNMFDGCSALRKVTLGEKFSFEAPDASHRGYLPAPEGDSLTGMWLSSADGKAYAPDAVPDNVAATYTAQVSQAKVDISGALVSDIPDSVYTGSAIEPAVEVAYGGERLAEGVDYTVSYSNNVYAGEATVTVRGVGGYSGEATRTFEILPAAVEAPVAVGGLVYTGEPQAGVVSTSDLFEVAGGTAMGAGSYVAAVALKDKVNCVWAGTGEAGDVEVPWEIAPAAMDRGMVSGVPAEMTATGSQLAPEPVVTFNGERLVEGRDYIVSYGDNVEPGVGAGSVTVSAVEGGNFTGSVTVYFDIEKAPEPEPQRFAVIYHLDGGANADANPASYVAGTAVALGSPTKEGYEFQGWFADPGFEKQVTEISADSTGDVELWAKWAQKAEPKPAPVFPDVDYGEWYAPGVTFVAGKGLITGYAANGHFGVGDPLTRGQLATILWRNACPEEAAAYDASTARNETGLSGVSDGEYYTAAANWAVREGIITGFERADGTYDFAASNPVSFEQLITILSRLCAAPGEVAAAGSDLSGFVDGDEASSWAAGAIAWAAKKGLVGGYDTPSGKVLAPGEEVARERVAVVLMRAFDLGIME